MGRKGLGKLAGFGVAKRVEVITLARGAPHATKITLSFDELTEDRNTHAVAVPEELIDASDFGLEQGTRIILSELLYDPLKSRAQTITNEISDHFQFINPGEFAIHLNGDPVLPPKRTFAFAWPDPDQDHEAFIPQTLKREGGGTVAFTYRIRFTGVKESLPAARRGVRVYAHNRLAAMPSLLDADTNMHGFRMTDYMDGVVHADFIDEEETDYIATDRQSLRWDSPLLSPLYEFLSDEIKEACKRCQANRDTEARGEVEKDKFTVDEIAKYDFSRSERTMARRIATVLARSSKQGVEDPDYKTRLPPLLDSIGRGTLMAELGKLAASDAPDLKRVASQIMELARDEFDQFVQSVKGRLKGVHALQKIVQSADFKKPDNEKIIQRLLERSPWLIDPTYSQFLTADQAIDTLFDKLAQQLGVGKHAKTGLDERPDLVFLLGSTSLGRLVIVELKSSNKPLESVNLDQLESYLEEASVWLADRGHPQIVIQGQLLGTFGDPKSRARGIVSLRRRIKKAGLSADWKVRDYAQVLTDTENAHKEILTIQGRLDAASA